MAAKPQVDDLTGVDLAHRDDPHCEPYYVKKHKTTDSLFGDDTGWNSRSTNRASQSGRPVVVEGRDPKDGSHADSSPNLIGPYCHPSPSPVLP